MSSLPRGTCPTCGASVALRKGGKVREHKDQRHHLYRTGRNDEVPTCEGSGVVVASLSRRVAVVELTYDEARILASGGAREDAILRRDGYDGHTLPAVADLRSSARRKVMAAIREANRAAAS